MWARAGSARQRRVRCGEVNPARLESFAGRMGPGARRRLPIARRRRRGWSARQREAVGIREHQAVGAVGVAADAESTLVVEAVVTVAETKEVPAHGRSAV